MIGFWGGWVGGGGVENWYGCWSLSVGQIQAHNDLNVVGIIC